MMFFWEKKTVKKSPKMAKIKNIFCLALFDSLWLPYELSIALFFKWPPKGAENDRQSSKFGSKNGHFEGERGVQKNFRSIFSPFHVISENR